MEAISVGAVYVHAFFLVVEIFLGFFFLFLCCRRWKSRAFPKTHSTTHVLETSRHDLKTKFEDNPWPIGVDGITQVGNGLYSKPHRTTDSSTEKEKDIMSTSPLKRNGRRHSLEDLFEINEEEDQVEISQKANGHVPQFNRRNSMVVLSEPPPLTRKQRKRQHRKQFQLANSDHQPTHHSKTNILSENRVQEVSSDARLNPTQYQPPVTTQFSSHYHTIHSPSRQNSSAQLPWKEVKRSGSMDNLYVRNKVNPNQGASADGRNQYVQPEQSSRFVVQPVVNVYLNSRLGDPLETSNKYDLLNSSLHDDPTPLKERSLNYGLETTCNRVESQSVLPVKHKSRFNSRKKQLFSESGDQPIENNLEVTTSLAVETMDEKTKKPQPHPKLKRSKSSSPKRVGQTVKQRVLFENFNPDNADWIRGMDNAADGI
jgi:hypothetical protein